MSNLMNTWCVAQTHPHAEEKAVWHLGRQGFSTYLPRYLKRRRHARRTEWVKASLFPRYLFIAMDVATTAWRSINSTVGISHLVCRAGVPALVPQGVIEELRAREDNDGFIPLENRRAFLKGEPVRIVDGALIDQIGLFDCASDEDRVVVLLNLLGRNVRVRIPSGAVVACA